MCLIKWPVSVCGIIKYGTLPEFKGRVETLASASIFDMSSLLSEKDKVA